MRLLKLATALLLLAACGSQGPAGGPPSFGTVTGHVRSYPCAPVELGGSPCSGRPAAHVEIDFSLGSKPPVRGITDAEGNSAVQLAPGAYQVSIGVLRLLSGPHTVYVDAGKTVTADFVFDSGIR